MPAQLESIDYADWDARVGLPVGRLVGVSCADA